MGRVLAFPNRSGTLGGGLNPKKLPGVRNVLRAVDFDVLCARNFYEAIHFVDSGAKIDIAVVDVKMPAGTPDCISFARVAQRSNPGMKIIFMSGRLSLRDFTHLRDDETFLCKPFVPHQLLEVVTRAAWRR